MQLIEIVQIFFALYSFILLARVLIGWFQVDPYNPLVQTLYALTEPLLSPIRRILPPAGPFDFSPIVAFILLQVVEQIIVAMLASALR